MSMTGHNNGPAPQPGTSWHTAIGNFLSGGVVPVGATEIKHEWVTAGRLAADLPATRYFAQETQHG
ncbi:MAG: hypothetical protein WD046_09480 [Paracoccaceae bacterium]